MKLGFLTVCLGSWMTLEEKMRYAAKEGYKAVEVGCWPVVNGRDFSSSDIDVANLTPEKAKEITELAKELGLEISSLAYYDNNLSADESERAFINAHTKKVIDAAQMLGVELVGTFIGRNHLLTLEENFDLFAEVFGDLVAYAESKGVKIMIENCPMPDWQVKGLPGTISYSPELWRELFKRVPSMSFGLNYDPSHLNFMMMDYITPIAEFGNRIFHVHAKDSAVDLEALKQYGLYNRQIGATHDNGIWKFSMPGHGTVDFDGMIKALKAVGYDGVISIEHEDPEYSGTLEKTMAGLDVAKEHLLPLMA